MKKQFLILFAFISVLALSQVPQRFNKVVVTGDITSPKFIKTGSNADSVLLGNGSARAISTIKTDTVNLSNRINAKATGSGTANGTNTGDETLTSIKTKLGAATSVSDGYLKYQDWNIFNSKVSNATHTGDVTGSTALTLATVNSNVGTFNNVTINAKGLATAGSNVSYLTSITSGQVTTALGYTPKPTFTENTGFNKPFGTTTGTVLEGRTFGTSANSAVGDFIQNGTGVQAANFNINGSGTFGTGATIKAVMSDVQLVLGRTGNVVGDVGLGSNEENYLSLYDMGTYSTPLNIARTGAATFSSTVNSTGFLLNGNNLTSSLTTNYIPKWNGSSFVNSLVYDSGSSIGIGTTATPRKFCITSSDPEQLLLTSTSNTSGLFVAPANSSYTAFIGGTGNDLIFNTTGNTRLRIASGGEVNIYSTSTSTSPTTGAFVVNGGVGVGGVANLGGSRISGDGILSNGAGLELFYTASNKTSYIQNYHRGGDNLYHPIYIGGSYMQMDAGNVGVGYATDQGYKLAVNGTGFFNGAVTASSFYGNGSNLTGVQLPITLTTNGTSGAATFSGNVLNVPNYASTGIGGSYTASISSGSNTANPVVYSSLYTKNGTVYSSIIKGYIECTGSQGNTCTFNVSTYNGSTANLSIIGVGAQGTNIILGSGSTGSNVVMSFTNPVGSGGIGFTLIIHYTN
jgi:hypothetical protein